jgi:hypothetical protein
MLRKLILATGVRSRSWPGPMPPTRRPSRPRTEQRHSARRATWSGSTGTRKSIFSLYGKSEAGGFTCRAFAEKAEFRANRGN